MSKANFITISFLGGYVCVERWGGGGEGDSLNFMHRAQNKFCLHFKFVAPGFKH